MIDAYTFKLQELEDEDKLPKLPLKAIEGSFCNYLDAVANACEKGRLTADGWVKELFTTKSVFDRFLLVLSRYDECFRIHDRWYIALQKLAAVEDDEGFITTDEMSERLLEEAIESGQIKRDVKRPR